MDKDQKYQYMLLDRLRCDCLYFLGHANRNPKCLWAGNIDEHIQEMKNLHTELIVKPEWLTMDGILELESKMVQKPFDIQTLSDVNSFFKHLIDHYKISLHPDDDFKDYTYLETGHRVFNDDEAEYYNTVMDDCIMTCRDQKADIYLLSIKAHNL